MPRNNSSGGTARPRKQTGLRNRSRSGSGSYARKGKAKRADRYPAYERPATERDIDEKEGKRYAA